MDEQIFSRCIPAGSSYLHTLGDKANRANLALIALNRNVGSAPKRKVRAARLIEKIAKDKPELFVHWELGIIEMAT